MITQTQFDPEFDEVFTVHEDLSVEQSLYFAPSVFHDEAEDVLIDTPQWTALTGWTGQYGYKGAVMHASEQFEGGIRDHVLATPGTYVLSVVNVMAEEGDEDPEPAGWAVLRKN
jgi:hypothetical protein